MLLQNKQVRQLIHRLKRETCRLYRLVPCWEVLTMFCWWENNGGDGSGMS